MIGFFDSGIGGLTVLKELYKKIPDVNTIYFGDTARAPYGNKGEKVIKRYSSQVVNFLIKQGAEIIVIACNTASAVATNHLKDNFDLPIFEVVTPGVEKALKVSRNNRIAVLGTRATINSGIYSRLIKSKEPQARVFSKPAPLFVPLVEENWLKKPETKMIIQRYLQFQSQFDTLILACTHYGFLFNLIREELSHNVEIVDPGKELVKKLSIFLKDNKKIKRMVKGKKHKFLVSDKTNKFQELARDWLKKDIQLNQHSF